MIGSLRQMAGCWFRERWLLEMLLRMPRFACQLSLTWQDLHNRHERLSCGDSDLARVCEWQDSSWLTVAKVFPAVGSRLMQYCFKLWPISFDNRPPAGEDPDPDISVVIPVAGNKRFSQLRVVLDALAAQKGVSFEIIIVEENKRSVIPSCLKDRARHLLLKPAAGMVYCKSRMLNAGVAAARGRYVLLHDADIVVPSAYLSDIVRCLEAGYEGVRPLRFLFCLDDSNSMRFHDEQRTDVIKTVADIMQNFPGGSVAVRREVFERIGGMDEEFKGWGGEDLEFLDRLNTCRMFCGAWMPGIHLWHEPAVQKAVGHRNRDQVRHARTIPVNKRMATLLSPKCQVR